MIIRIVCIQDHWIPGFQTKEGFWITKDEWFKIDYDHYNYDIMNPPSMEYKEVGIIKLLLIRNNEIIGSYIDLRKYYMTVQEWNIINRERSLNLLI